MKRTIKILLIFVLSGMALFLQGCFYENEEEKSARVTVMQVLSDRSCIPETWTEIDYSHPWGLESQNYSAFEYYYIDQDKYSVYEDEWNVTEMDAEDLYKGYNEGHYDLYMNSNAEPVFHAVSVYPLSYKKDVQYFGKLLKKGKTYYHVSFYDKAVYYIWVTDYNPDTKTFYFQTVHDYDTGSLLAEYLVYEENGKWICERLSYPAEAKLTPK